MLISIDCKIAWFEEILELTIKIVLKFNAPPLALRAADPTVSPTDIDVMLKYPPSEVNEDVDMSGSFGSWLTLIVRFDKLSQVVSDKITSTVGEKGIHDTLPVFPPTQFPQLSVNAVPPKSLLQSVQSIVSEVVCISVCPSSDVIVEVRINVDGFWFVNKPVKITNWLFPWVTLLPSGNEFVIIRIPLDVFSIVKEEYTCPVYHLQP